jgi:FixJ family two-component response regulator
VTEAARNRIAVVDDEPSLCRALQRLLRVTGFDVDTFACGEAFLASLDVRVPDCVILDLHMPGMSGLEVQSRLASLHRGVPVVILTGHDAPAVHALALVGGAAAYLRKPVSEDLLLAAIHRCLGGRSGNGKTEQAGPNDRGGAREQGR